MHILGLDISLTHTGWALVNAQGKSVWLVKCGVIPTQKMETKEDITSTKDLLRRCAKIHKDIASILTPDGVDLVVMEAMSWPRNAASAIKMAAAWGAIAPLIAHKATIEVSPQALKLATAGSKSATKTEVESAVRSRLAQASCLLLEKQVPKKSDREHCWDALGAILAAQETSAYQLLLAGAALARP